MPGADKPEFPPLFPPGLHRLTMVELRQICVDAFPYSVSRPQIMSRLEAVVTRLHAAKVTGALWVDGSFLTHKIEPEDVDILLVCSGPYYETASPEVREAIDWVSSNLSESHLCDSYCLLTYPENHPGFWVGQWLTAYWTKQFGFSRDHEFKGIAVVVIDGVRAP